MQYKLYIFDLDDVLLHEGFDIPILCDDTQLIFNVLKNDVSKDVKIALASHNYDAEKILDAANLLKYFDHIEAYYDDSNKKTHLSRIIENFSNIQPEEMVFFDDVSDNIKVGKALHINSVLVNWETGIKFEQVFPQL